MAGRGDDDTLRISLCKVSSMIFIGIDPGKTGAVAILSDTISIKDTPDTLQGMVECLKHQEDAHVFIEKVHAMPGQGVVSMFTFGQNFGTWLGILAALGLSHTLVAPQTWKKEMLADLPKEKSSAVTRVLQLYPKLSDKFTRKKDHGRADALLIAEYGKRKVYGG